MRKWILLAATIVLEVAASLSLSAAQERPGWYVLVAVGYVGSFVMLAQVLRAGMPLGAAYGIWGACGVALTAVFGAVLFGDALSVTTGIGIAMAIGGVLLVELGSQRAERARAARTTGTSE
jgi:small multidrug resistance pump